MNHPFSELEPRAALLDPGRLTLALDCLSLLRRLSGRILGHGILPGHHIQDAMIELRDALEDLAGPDAGSPPSPSIGQQIQRIDSFLQATPSPSEIVSGISLTGTQKIILGDLVLYLGKAHELLQARHNVALPLEESCRFLHTTLEGLILLLTNILDEDLYESYDMPELIDRLMTSCPEAVSHSGRDAKGSVGVEEALGDEGESKTGGESQTSPSDLITDAITRALMQDGSGWRIDQSGLLEVPEGDATSSKDIANALFGSGDEDEAWNEIWIEEPEEEQEAGPGLRAEGFSEEIQAIHSNEVQGLFVSIAQSFCNPLPNLLANFQTKDLASEHLEGVYGIVLNIFNSAEQFGYEDLKQGLGRIRRVLERCQCDPELLTAREKLEVLAEYDALCVNFSNIFEPIGKQERGQRLRESIIIMEELRSIKGMGNKRIARLFAAGISNLRSFVEAQLGDFSAVSSIDRELAERILEAFRPYGVLVASSVIPATLEKFLDEQRQLLRNEVAELRSAHDEYSDESKKPKFRERRLRLRDLHRVRETAMSHIRCALAVLDEFDLIEAMRRIRYDKRLELLEIHLREQDRKAVAGGPDSLQVQNGTS